MPDWIQGIKEPKYKFLRVPLGMVLVVGGVLGFLPILGFWMIPLGLGILAIDYPAAARANHWLLKQARAIMLWGRLREP